MKLPAGLMILLTAFLGFQVLSACQNPANSRPQDPLAKQYQHIDRGEYSEAIIELTDLSTRDSRPEVLVTLASAYAARGGIKVAQYWGFVVGFKTPLLKANEVGDLAPPPEPEQEPITSSPQVQSLPAEVTNNPQFEGLARILKLWARYQERIDAIPVVHGSAYDDLNSAVQVLDRVQTPGGRLYRAILDLILFKTAIVAEEKPLKQAGALLSKAVSGQTTAICAFDLAAFLRETRLITYHLSETLNDLTMAFPEQAVTLIPARQQAQEIDQALVKSKKQKLQLKECR